MMVWLIVGLKIFFQMVIIGTKIKDCVSSIITATSFFKNKIILTELWPVTEFVLKELFTNFQ